MKDRNKTLSNIQRVLTMLEKAVLKAFEVHCSRKIEKETEEIASDRGEKTYIFPWDDPDGYVELVGDRGKFKTEVAEFLEKNAHATGRKPHCKDSSGYRLCGFRQKPRRTFAVEGRREFKKKLRQAESFPDRDCTLHIFRAMANARNFLPFLPGAKNAHRSPFMRAQGETFDLPWIEAMNVHNAFLFSDNAF